MTEVMTLEADDLIVLIVMLTLVLPVVIKFAIDEWRDRFGDTVGRIGYTFCALCGGYTLFLCVQELARQMGWL